MFMKEHSSSGSVSVDTPLVPHPEAASSRENWRTFSILFAINHAAVAVPLLYASTALMGTTGYNASGILYLSCLFGALFAAAPFVHVFDDKPVPAVAIAMSLNSLFILSFAAATALSNEVLQQVVMFSGAVIGGVGGSLLWTSQGTYFSRSARRLAQAEGIAYADVTSEQGSSFAFWFLLFEVIFRLGTSGLQNAGLNDMVVFGISGVFAFGAAVASAMNLENLQNEERRGNAPSTNSMRVLHDVLDVAKDPRIWCFAFTNFTFGLAAAYMNGFVNKEVTASQLGESSIGLLTAVTSFSAVGLAVTYGDVARCFGKGSVIFVGSCSMLAIPLCTLFANASSWGWTIVVLYICQGSARAIYEGINRAVFAEAFEDSAESAFALCSAQSSFAFAAGFFASAASDSGSTETAVLVMMAAILTYPLFHTAQQFQFSSLDESRSIDTA